MDTVRSGGLMTVTVASAVCPCSVVDPVATLFFTPTAEPITLDTIVHAPGGRFPAPAKLMEVGVVVTVPGQLLETCVPTVSPAGSGSVNDPGIPKVIGFALVIVKVSCVVWPTVMVVGENSFLKVGAKTVTVLVAVRPAKSPPPGAELFFTPGEVEVT